MICHTFGKPAIGAGKPGHACVAYKTASPMEKPHPGSAWKIGYGRGWEYPKLEGMSIKVAAAYVDQVFHIPSGTSEPVTLKIPWSKGLWDTTPMVDIKLERGPQILRISAPLQRATAVHRVELKSK